MRNYILILQVQILNITHIATSFRAHFLINMDRWLLDKWMQRKGAEESLLIIVKTNVIVRDRERERERDVIRWRRK